MSRFFWMTAVLSLAGFVAGCGESQDTAGPSETLSEQTPPTHPPAHGAVVAGSAQPGNASPANANRPSPAHVTAQFYEALRSGDSDDIGALLTDKARHETAKNDLDIRSQASTSLTYEIGETDYVTEKMDGAHVATLWTETDEQGQAITSPVIWVLRKQSNGWRVAGMATPVVQGELPIFFDFENPLDMMRTKEFVENEVYGGQEEQVNMAQQPTYATESPSANTEIR